jgi:hypothetical protein
MKVGSNSSRMFLKQKSGAAGDEINYVTRGTDADKVKTANFKHAPHITCFTRTYILAASIYFSR